ncbi:MAG: 4Fe-4S dicluster domain-containing protein, partial [Firmicutes bacterium]|nr:4Fe-4S dicluster domain-containing protein [Bacillota bacterium]
AVRDGEPLISRVVTVSGSPISEPKNFLAPIGVQFKDLVAACGGFKNEVGKVIVGGPLMGVAQFDLEASVCKTVTGLIAFEPEESRAPEAMPCIKCSRCVEVCPAQLMPLRLQAFALQEMWDEALEYGVLDCIECGACNYICPSKRPLLEYIRLAKQEIAAIQNKSS